MAFFIDTDTFEKWKYHISEFIMLFPKGKQHIIPPERIKSINISHNYETDWFPVFRVEVLMEPTLYYDMIKNKDSVKIKFRIQKYYRKVGSETKSLYRDYINDTFDLILDDLDYDKDSGYKQEESSHDYTNSKKDDKNDLFASDNLIELFLFKSSMINKSNKTVNAVLSNVTSGDAIAYIFKKIGMSNILMSPVENKDNYEALIIPPLKARDAIQFVGIYYGLFKKGYVAYIDFITGITYILNRNGKATAWVPKEKYETIIMLPKRNTSYSGDVCSLRRKGAKITNYLIADTQNISIRNESTSFNVYSALDSLSVDSYSGATDSNSSSATTKGEAANKTIIDRTENKWFKYLFTTVSDSKDIVVQISTGDYDASVITPNKKYKILFEDSELSKKYKGTYFLSNAVHVFLKEGNDFSINSTFTFNILK